MADLLRLLIEHGPLSKPAEVGQFLIAFLGLSVAAFADGDSDLRPIGVVLGGAAAISLMVSLAGTPLFREEWHVGLITILLVVGFVAYDRMD